jgi:hypothetical protein
VGSRSKELGEHERQGHQGAVVHDGARLGQAERRRPMPGSLWAMLRQLGREVGMVGTWHKVLSHLGGRVQPWMTGHNLRQLVRSYSMSVR